MGLNGQELELTFRRFFPRARELLVTFALLGPSSWQRRCVHCAAKCLKEHGGMEPRFGDKSTTKTQTPAATHIWSGR